MGAEEEVFMKAVIIKLVISTLIFIVALLCIMPVDLTFTKTTNDSIQIMIRYQRTTGPFFYVIYGTDKLAKAVSMPYPDDLNVTEVEITGKQIKELQKYPELRYDTFIVVGTITGLTDKYQICGDGTIPVFHVEQYKPVGWIKGELYDNLSDIKIIILFIVIVGLYILVIILIILTKIRKPINRSSDT